MPRDVVIVSLSHKWLLSTLDKMAETGFEVIEAVLLNITGGDEGPGYISSLRVEEVEGGQSMILENLKKRRKMFICMYLYFICTYLH